MKTHPIKTLVTALAILGTSSLHAAVVIWTGTAELTTLESNLQGIVNLGDSVAIEVSYDSSASPSYSTFIAGGDLAEYREGANVYIRFTIGSNVWEGQQSLSPGARTASIHDNANGVVDNVSFILQDGWSNVASNANISGPNANRLRIYFSSSASGDLIDGTSLPDAGAVNLSDLYQFFGYIDNDDVSSRFTGDASTVTVPEPSSALLLGGAALISLFYRRGRR